MRSVIWFALVCGWSCAADAPGNLSLSIPWPIDAAQTSCPAGRLDGMEAELHVAGNYPVCALDVDADTHRVTGQCELDYRTGDELPLMVVYRLALTDPEAHSAILAVAVGTADLRASELPETEEVYVATVTIEQDDVVKRQPQIDVWRPSEECGPVTTGTSAARARVWAWCYIDLHPELFDDRDAEVLFLCRNPTVPDQPLGDSALDLLCGGGTLLTSCLPPTN